MIIENVAVVYVESELAPSLYSI